MFVGRKRELDVLDNFYKSQKFEMMVLYGRRRIGKTRLLNEFIRDRNAIFFAAQEDNDLINLELFSETVLEHFNVGHYPAFDRWDDAFRFIGEEILEERTVLVIDELPYLAKGNKSFMSILQNAIDHIFINTNLMIVLCGSYVSFMEDELVSTKSPLYGRKIGQLKLQPLTFAEASQMFPKYSVQDRFRIYSICGGIPHYLVNIDQTISVDENIVTRFMDNASFLYDEPMGILRQEFRNPAVYNAIVRAIADGKTKIQEISDVLKESTSKVTNNINTLMALGIIEKITPVTGDSSRKSYYKIVDHLFIFMHHHVYRYHSLIEQGMGRAIFEKKLKSEMNISFGYAFEEVCLQYLIARNQEMSLPFLVEDFGTWWGQNPYKKREEEMDILGLTKDDGLYCECKYRNQEASMEVFNTLVARSQLVPRKNQHYIIFSIESFTQGLIEQEQKDFQLELVTLKDIDEWYQKNG